MEDELETAMPEALSLTFYSGHATEFLSSMTSEYTSGQGPAWFSAMPTDLQTYLYTEYLQLVEENLDWGGTSPVIYQALIPTKSGGSAFTVQGPATLM